MKREFEKKFEELEKEGFSKLFWCHGGKYKEYSGLPYILVGRDNQSDIPQWLIKFYDSTVVSVLPENIILQEMIKDGCPLCNIGEVNIQHQSTIEVIKKNQMSWASVEEFISDAKKYKNMSLKVFNVIIHGLYYPSFETFEQVYNHCAKYQLQFTYLEDLEKTNIAQNSIDSLSDIIGSTIYDAFCEEDNSCYEIGKHMLTEIHQNRYNPIALQAADNMMTAITGYGIKSLVERIVPNMKVIFTSVNCDDKRNMFQYETVRQFIESMESNVEKVISSIPMLDDPIEDTYIGEQCFSHEMETVNDLYLKCKSILN